MLSYFLMAVNSSRVNSLRDLALSEGKRITVETSEYGGIEGEIWILTWLLLNSLDCIEVLFLVDTLGWKIISNSIGKLTCGVSEGSSNTV